MYLNNKLGLKKGDSFKISNFNGDAVITSVFETYVKIKMRHSSGSDYSKTMYLSDFNNKIIIGDIYSIIKN